MNKPTLIILITLMVLISGCVQQYDKECLDNIANNICKERGYEYGIADRMFAGDNLNIDLLRNEPYIVCSNDERSYKEYGFKYTKQEIFECKPKWQ